MSAPRKAPKIQLRIPERFRFAAALVAGEALRLALFFYSSSLCNALSRRPELQSPLTSIRSLREGVYLHTQGIDPYAGGAFYHSPIYLRLFTRFIDPQSDVSTALLWTTSDIFAAFLLVKIWKARSVALEPKWRGREWVVAFCYLFNPYTVLSCLARSTTTLENVLVLGAIFTACSYEGFMSMSILALATQTSLYPVILLIPLLRLLSRDPKASPGVTFINLAYFLGVFAAFTAALSAGHGTIWMDRTWGLILKVTDLTPNVGMWWYFFTEMFDHFRTFFRGVFQMHLLIYIAPLCIRLPDPMQTILLLVGVISTWKSYPTLGDMALWAGLLACFPEYVEELRHPLFTLTTHLYTAILLPLLHSLWLLTGTGNANFFYAATMVYGLNSTLAVADVLSAMIGYDLKAKLRAVAPAEAERATPVQLASL